METSRVDTNQYNLPFMTRGLQEDCGNDDILRTVRGSSSRNLSITRRGSYLFLKIKFNGVLTHYVFHKKRLKLFFICFLINLTSPFPCMRGSLSSQQLLTCTYANLTNPLHQFKGNKGTVKSKQHNGKKIQHAAKDEQFSEVKARMVDDSGLFCIRKKCVQ